MNIRKITAALLAALLIMLNGFPVSALETQALPDQSTVLDETPPQELTSDAEKKSDVPIPEDDNNPDNTKGDTSIIDNGMDSAEDSSSKPENGTDNNTENEKQPDSENNEEKTDIPTSDEAPAFYAKVEYSFEGYIVKGTFTEFTPDTILVQPLYSLDGENYQICGENWDLRQLGTEDENIKAKLQNQICLYSNYEPLKSYLAEKLDRFYMKLRITRENGITYETQPAVIDRGVPQSIPEGINLGAMFSPDMAVFEPRPFNYYGRYQLTISEKSTAEEISAYLPDTLPIKICLQAGKNPVTDGIVNCPVTWKPLSLPQLTAGESVTIADAAEEIVVPAGTLVTTPIGIYQLDEPLHINQYAPTDEVRLVLNVISENENPTGALSQENAGLEMSFQLKPTGATAIRAYTLSEGDSEWKEIPNLPLLEAVNAQPSTKNSDYTLILHNNLEPYHSYLEAQKAGDTPTPFLIGLKIEGGVYNGKQLILPWPDTYELPLKLPDIGGSGGNHNNAGSGNKNDSTESGQRPNLPQTPENKPHNTTPPEDTKNNTNSGNKNDSPVNEQPANIPPNQGNKPEATVKPDDTEKNPDSGNHNTADEQQPNLPQNPENRPQATAKPEDKNEQQPDYPQNPNNKQNTPIKLNKPNNTSDYRIPLNQRNTNTNLRYTPFSEFPTMAQAQADISGEKRSPNFKVNRKAQTNSPGERTTPDSLQAETRIADSLFSSNKEEKTDRWEIPDRTTAGKQHELFLSVAVIAMAGLGIAGIYFVTVSGKIAEKSRILRKLLLRK